MVSVEKRHLSEEEMLLIIQEGEPATGAILETLILLEKYPEMQLMLAGAQQRRAEKEQAQTPQPAATTDEVQ